eukprot:tig00020965_g16873.t1
MATNAVGRAMNTCRGQNLQGFQYDDCLMRELSAAADATATYGMGTASGTIATMQPINAPTYSTPEERARAYAQRVGVPLFRQVDADDQVVAYSAEAFDAALDDAAALLAAEGDDAALPADEGAAAADFDFGFGAEAEGDARLL